MQISSVCPIFIPIFNLLNWNFQGPGPKVTDGTQAILKVSSNEEFLEEKDQWDVCIKNIANDTLTLQVTFISSLHALVGGGRKLMNNPWNFFK